MIPRLRDLIAPAVARLAAAGVEDAARDVRRLLAFAFGLPMGRLTLHLDDPADAAGQAAFVAALAERAARRPLAQITGERLFWGRGFQVTSDTLDPRPETEILVAAALEEPFAQVLDLGTGTGAILLSLLADRPGARGLGTDLSPAALGVARANAGRLGVAARAELRVADWFAGVAGRFDLIVANPPYIAAAEMAGLAPEVRDWEPHLALTPGGAGQGAEVARLFVAAGLVLGGIRPDMEGHDRVVEARCPPD